MQRKKPEILTLAEIRKLLSEAKALNHAWYPVWALAILTGMRSGELYALTWQDVDWENHSINVNKSYNGRLKAIKSTKAGYWRTVPISPELKVLLQEIKATANARETVLPRFWKWTKSQQARELRQFCIGIGIPELQAMLRISPKAGDVIQGSGGFRKVRWTDSRRGKGKRGGLRVIYYFFPEDEQIWLLTIYGKDEADDLTAEQRKILKAAINTEKHARLFKRGRRR